MDVDVVGKLERLGAGGSCVLGDAKEAHVGGRWGVIKTTKTKAGEQVPITKR